MPEKNGRGQHGPWVAPLEAVMVAVLNLAKSIPFPWAGKSGSRRVPRYIEKDGERSRRAEKREASFFPCSPLPRSSLSAYSHSPIGQTTLRSRKRTPLRWGQRRRLPVAEHPGKVGRAMERDRWEPTGGEGGAPMKKKAFEGRRTQNTALLRLFGGAVALLVGRRMQYRGCLWQEDFGSFFSGGGRQKRAHESFRRGQNALAERIASSPVPPPSAFHSPWKLSIHPGTIDCVPYKYSCHLFSIPFGTVFRPVSETPEILAVSEAGLR